MILIWFVSCILCIQSISAFVTFPNVENLDIVYPPQTSPDSFVVGGEIAPDGLAPYQCSLQTNKRHFCGCAILSSKWIVTAAHCVEKDLSTIQVLVGTTNLQSNGKRYNVEKIIRHDRYNNPSLAYDIAVLKVVETITFNENVRPIKLAPKEVPDNVPARLTGWGRLSTGGQVPDRLQVLTVNTVSTERCKRIHKSNVHDSHICAFSKRGQGACYGDSGGPLVYNDELIGVVNWGRPCARGIPDAYAKVSYLYGWINENTASA